MSIDRIRYFAAVVETRNLRKAAELVRISPPSMSKAISVLEGELGHKLIHPDGRGIGITPKGLEIYHLSQTLLGEHQRFFENIQNGIKNSQQLRISTFEVFSTYFMSSFLKSIPQWDVFLLEKTPGEIESSILAGLVDIGITYLPAPEPSLDYTEIGSFKMGIFGLQKWTEKSFDEWPFAVPTTELRIHSSDIFALDMWPQNVKKRRIKFHFELLETALQVSRKGLAVVHCPNFIIQLQNRDLKSSQHLISLPYPKNCKSPKPIKIYLVSKKGSSLIKELEGKLAKFIRSINSSENLDSNF